MFYKIKKYKIKATEQAQLSINHFSEPVKFFLLEVLPLHFCNMAGDFFFQVLCETSLYSFKRPVLVPDAPGNAFTLHRRCIQLQVSPI